MSILSFRALLLSKLIFRLTLYSQATSYEWLGFASVETSQSPNSQKYDIICPSDSSEEKSIHWFVGAFFKLETILTVWGLGFNTSFFSIEYSEPSLVTTVRTISYSQGKLYLWDGFIESLSSMTPSQ